MALTLVNARRTSYGCSVRFVIPHAWFLGHESCPHDKSWIQHGRVLTYNVGYIRATSIGWYLLGPAVRMLSKTSHLQARDDREQQKAEMRRRCKGRLPPLHPTGPPPHAEASGLKGNMDIASRSPAKHGVTSCADIFSLML
jgi:hypothetical protein